MAVNWIQSLDDYWVSNSTRKWSKEYIAMPRDGGDRGRMAEQEVGTDSVGGRKTPLPIRANSLRIPDKIREK